jgi:hypothetical protein
MAGRCSEGDVSPFVDEVTAMTRSLLCPERVPGHLSNAAG